MNERSRISRLERSLEIDELVALLLENVQKHDQPDDYLRMALAEPLALVPAGVLTDPHGGQKKNGPGRKKLQRVDATLSRLRYVLLLMFTLNSDVVGIVDSSAAKLETVRAILDLAGLYTLPNENTDFTRLRHRLNQARGFVTDTVIDLWAGRSCTHELSARYAAGQPLLFRSVESNLAETAGAAEDSIDAYNHLVEALGEGELGRIGLGTLEESATQRGLELAEALAARVYAEHLIAHGEDRRALDVLSPYLKPNGGSPQPGFHYFDFFKVMGVGHQR